MRAKTLKFGKLFFCTNGNMSRYVDGNQTFGLLCYACYHFYLINFSLI